MGSGGITDLYEGAKKFGVGLKNQVKEDLSAIPRVFKGETASKDFLDGVTSSAKKLTTGAKKAVTGENLESPKKKKLGE
jgi:hypothetical protein